MKVKILEKVVYTKSLEVPKLTIAKPEREKVELKWIKELGIAGPYGRKINGVGVTTNHLQVR